MRPLNTGMSKDKLARTSSGSNTPPTEQSNLVLDNISFRFRKRQNPMYPFPAVKLRHPSELRHQHKHVHGSQPKPGSEGLSNDLI
jgi:hypothetical protein